MLDHIGFPVSDYARSKAFYEKALKPLQIRRGVLVQRVHNLTQIVDELPAADVERFEVRDLDELNPWTIDGRYPADHEDVSHETADAVLNAARRVVAAVKDGW